MREDAAHAGNERPWGAWDPVAGVGTDEPSRVRGDPGPYTDSVCLSAKRRKYVLGERCTDSRVRRSTGRPPARENNRFAGFEKRTSCPPFPSNANPRGWLDPGGGPATNPASATCFRPRDSAGFQWPPCPGRGRLWVVPDTPAGPAGTGASFGRPGERGHPRAPEPMARNPNKKRCGAKNRAGTPCRRWAVVGRTRCKLHGGGSPRLERLGVRRPPGRPITHGRYSKKPRRSLLDAMHELQDFLAPGGRDDGIRYLKGLFSALLNEATSLDDPILTGPRGRDIPAALIDRIARLVGKRHKIIWQHRFLLAPRHVEAVYLAMGRIVAELVEPDRQGAARERLVGLLKHYGERH